MHTELHGVRLFPEIELGLFGNPEFNLHTDRDLHTTVYKAGCETVHSKRKFHSKESCNQYYNKFAVLATK